MDISPLDPSEAPQAAALWAEAGVSHPWNDPYADIAAALACPTSNILTARDNGRIVATAMAGYDGHRGWLYYVAVADSHRGTGCGRAVMSAAEQWLHARGAHVIRLMVRRTNEGALGFYEKLGYEAGDLIVMGKRLED